MMQEVYTIFVRGASLPNPHQDCSAGVTRPTRSAQEQSRSDVLIFHAVLELRLHPHSPHVLKCPLLLGLMLCGQLRLLRIYLIYTDATPSVSRALGLFLLAGWLSVSVLGPRELLSACARHRNWLFSSVGPFSIFSFVSKAGTWVDQFLFLFIEGNWPKIGSGQRVSSRLRFCLL